MSSNTPNLALTKFTQGENFNNSILNANWEKVDAYVGTNSLGSGTISTIQDALLTLSTSMSAGQIAKIKFDISTASAPFGATGYVGYISKINSNRLCVNVRTAMYTTNEVVGNYKDGSWYWDVFALNSQITNLDNKTAEKTITKESQSSDTTLKFTFTGNRYTALVFKTDNMSANSGIYAITFKASGVTTIDKLSGSSTLPTVDSDGSINVGVHAWSKVTVMTDSDNYFS